MEKIHYNSFLCMDKIPEFDCGNSRLNKFFIEEAADTENYGLGNTTLFFDTEKDKIIGFYTLSINILEIDFFKGYNRFKKYMGTRYSKKLEQDFNTSSFPVLEIMRLAVDISYQGKKLGTRIVLSIYKDIIDLRLKYNLPVNNVYIEALSESTEFYDTLGFEFVKFSYDEQPLHETYPMMISFDKILDIATKAGIL